MAAPNIGRTCVYRGPDTNLYLSFSMSVLRFMIIRPTAEMQSQIRKHSVDSNRSLHHRIFKKKLLLTNSLTSGGCMVIGDLMQQEIEYHSQMLSFRYDWLRLVRMCAVGITIGPLHHYYYGYLDKFLPKVNLKTVLLKIACDQTIASPLTLVTFYIVGNMLEMKTLRDCKNEIESKFLYTYMGDCIFWPPIQFVNFYFLPTHYRVVYINAATIVFNVFLSFIKHIDQH